MYLSEDAQRIVNESPNQSELTAVIERAQQQLEQHLIIPTELQWTVLINHLNEMIKRSKIGESIPTVDPEMFEGISEEALLIAAALVELIGSLPIDEMYVLSIHFEAAKQNDGE